MRFFSSAPGECVRWLLLLCTFVGFSQPVSAAQQVESLQEWQDAFVTELEQRLDRAELDWPARFAQVRAANGAGDPFGLTYFTTAAENFRAQYTHLFPTRAPLLLSPLSLTRSRPSETTSVRPCTSAWALITRQSPNRGSAFSAPAD